MTDLAISCIISLSMLGPLAWKWELDLRLVLAWAVAAGIVIGGLLHAVDAVHPLGRAVFLLLDAALILAVSAAALLMRFYRRTERRPPPGRDLIVSPADGTIKYLKPISPETAPFSSKGAESVPLSPPLSGMAGDRGGYLVGIGMSLLDEHVTRAPISGRVAHLQRIPGVFLSLKKREAAWRNERLIGIIEDGERKVGLIHIASRLVRRIESYVTPGDFLCAGQEVGIIRFGSQVDIVIPGGLAPEIRVRVGQRVHAGVSVIAGIRTGKEETAMDVKELEKEFEQGS